MRPPIFYGRRQGRRLNQDLQHHAETHLLQNILKPEDWLSWQGPIWLEIGIGNGEHMLALAARHPDHLFIGCEPFRNGVVRASRDLAKARLANIKLWPDDARPLMASLPDKLLQGLIILFPDPWPKRRHKERRLLGPALWPEIVRLLKPGGELRFASDHAGYVAWAMHHLSWCKRECEPLHWENHDPNQWHQRPHAWPATRYEEKRLAGPPVWLQFRRLT